MARATQEELEERLEAYVTAGASFTTADDGDYITACVMEAMELVDHEIGTAPVPDPVVDRAVIEVGSELYNRRSAPNGISQFASPDGGAVRIARDPMVGARPLLAPFLGLGFA